MSLTIDNPLLPDPIIVPPDVEITTDLLVDPDSYPLSNQAELHTIEEDETESTTEAVVGQHTEQLELASGAIGELAELESTIKAKGVSSHDMSALCAIQERLGEAGLDMPVVSQEGHDAIYLPLRSYLNQQVALESVASTILATIKAWLTKLIDLAVSGYRWVKNLRNKHTLLRAQLDHARSVLIKIEKIHKKMLALYPSPTNIYTDNMVKLPEILLGQATIPPTEASLYSFGYLPTVVKVKGLYAQVDEARLAITGQIGVMVNLLNAGMLTEADRIYVPPCLDTAVGTVVKLTSIQPIPHWLVGTLGKNVFNDLTPIKDTIVIDFDRLMNCYGAIAGTLKQLQRVSALTGESADVMQYNIDTLTETLTKLNTLISFFSQAARGQTTAIKCYRDYYAAAIQYLLTDFTASNPSADSIAEMNKLVKEVSMLK